MALEDLHPDQSPMEMALRMDVGRMAWNIHSILIPRWRAMYQGGQDPRPEMAADARALLGRLRRAYEGLQDSGILASQVVLGGMTRADIEADLVARRNVLRAFRDAPKSTVAQARDAVDALAAAFPVQRPKPATEFFLDRPQPTDW